MSNVKEDRYVESDWWSEPIPPNVIFGAGFYCETAQIFRFLRNREEGALRLGDYVSCYAGCSFSLGQNGRCTVGDFTLMNGALVMAEELIKIGQLRVAFADWLHMASKRGRIVLVLDGLDALEDKEGARDLLWLPAHLSLRDGAAANPWVGSRQLRGEHASPGIERKRPAVRPGNARERLRRDPVGRREHRHVTRERLQNRQTESLAI